MRLFEPVPFRGATHLKIGPPRGRCGRLLQNEQPWDRRLVAPCNTFGGADAKKESRPDVTMSRILPLGFDMQTKSKKHWFGSHPKEMDREHGFAAWRENFRNANCPTPIINCSRATALDCFPRSTIQDEL